MTPSGSYVSLKEICNSWLLNWNKHPNVRYSIIKLAAEAVRELSLTSLPLLQHKLITREPGQTWFDLPDDFTDWVSVGIRSGGVFRPVGMSSRLVPVGSYDGTTDLGADFGNGFGNAGAQDNWGDPAVREGDYDGADFSDADFLTTGKPGQGGGGAYARGRGWRADTVTLNAVQGQILTGTGFPSDELYLVYIGVGSVDTMTQLPVIAQAAIEAYIDYKYFERKRNIGIGEVREWERKWVRQHKILRARLNPLTILDVRQLRYAQWEGLSWRDDSGTVSVQSNQPPAGAPDFNNDFNNDFNTDFSE